MQKNFWNLKNSKRCLGLRERTQAYKRHLLGLIKAKSKVDDRNKGWKTKSLNSSIIKRQRQSISKQNGGMVNRIINADKSRSHRSSTASVGRKFISLRQNLRNKSSQSRQLRKKQIQQENNKFFNRLVNTSSTMPKSNWVKSIKDTNLYRKNLIKAKYHNIDFNSEAMKISSGKRLTYNHLKMISQKQLPFLCKSSRNK